MSTLKAQTGFTICEYLAREGDSLEKHEYREGQIIAMSGGSVQHSLITLSVGGELRSRLKGKQCKAFDSNLRVRIPRSVLYTYPDATVICGPVQFDPDDPLKHTVTNPTVIVEVLSPSTEAYDRGEKFGRYQQLDSLQLYVLVLQSTPRVELFLRQPEGTWLLSAVNGLESNAHLFPLGISLPLSEIYAGVDFDAAT